MTEYDEIMANVPDNGDEDMDSDAYDTDEELKEAFAAVLSSPASTSWARLQRRRLSRTMSPQ